MEAHEKVGRDFLQPERHDDEYEIDDYVRALLLEATEQLDVDDVIVQYYSDGPNDTIAVHFKVENNLNWKLSVLS